MAKTQPKSASKGGSGKVGASGSHQSGAAKSALGSSKPAKFNKSHKVQKP